MREGTIQQSGGMAALAVRELTVPTRDCTIRLSNIRIEPGHCAAFIGSNGSGKTTVIEAILGLRRTTALAGSLLGHDFAEWGRRPQLRQRLGILLQRTALPAGLQVRDIVRLHRGIYPRTEAAVLEALGIEPLLDKKYERLSRGEALRAELILGLAHQPEIAFLDEPFTGLDQNYMAKVSALLSRFKSQGSTVVMACHSAQELALADHVAWMHRGELVEWGQPDELRRKLLGDYRLQVSFASIQDATWFREKVVAQTRPQYIKSTEPGRLSIYGSEALMQFAHSLVESKSSTTLEFGPTTLGDLLLRCASGDAHA